MTTYRLQQLGLLLMIVALIVFAFSLETDSAKIKAKCGELQFSLVSGDITSYNCDKEGITFEANGVVVQVNSEPDGALRFSTSMGDNIPCNNKGNRYDCGWFTFGGVR